MRRHKAVEVRAAIAGSARWPTTIRRGNEFAKEKALEVNPDGVTAVF
jgi:hypothetical protein